MKINLNALLLLLLFAVCSCKKSTSNNVTGGNTFFKLYNVPIAKDSKTTRTTTYSSGAMVSDNDGNIYVWYYDSLVAGRHRFAIIKTDKNGKKIWNESYIPFDAFRVDIDLNNNNLTWQDFTCNGQSLFIGGRDS